MSKIKVICAACLRDLHDCVCKDEPEKEHPGFAFNRMGEELMRWLRFFCIIK